MKVIVASNIKSDELPINAILYWGGKSTELPEGWSIYADAADAFIMGTDPSGILLTKQGTVEHYHSENGTDSHDGHTHDNLTVTSGTERSTSSVKSGDIQGTYGHTHQFNVTFGTSNSHSHSITNTSTNNHLAKYIRFYLMKNDYAVDIPIRAIALWSGNLDTIPEGWRICDGSTQDDFTVPNIVGRFIYIPSSDDNQGLTGGNDTHNHTRASDTNTGGSHTHSLSVSSSSMTLTFKFYTSGDNKQVALVSHNHDGTVNSPSDGSHTHTLPSINSANNNPPYIYLYYIMKVA